MVWYGLVWFGMVGSGLEGSKSNTISYQGEYRAARAAKNVIKAWTVSLNLQLIANSLKTYPRPVTSFYGWRL